MKYLNKYIIVIVAIVVLAVGYTLKTKSYEKKIQDLQNQIVSQEKTIELVKNVYEHSTLLNNSISNILSNSKDTELQQLKKQLNNNKSQILDLTEINVSFKKNYEALVKANQSNVPNQPNRVKVDFAKDFGYLKVKGYTLTNPAEAYINISQGRPLKLSLSLALGSDNKWKTYVTTNEDNILVDITLTAVNPKILDHKWYERIGFVGNLGAGAIFGSGNALFGLGASLDFGKFSLGPMIWFSTTGAQDRYYGLTFTWRPF